MLLDLPLEDPRLQHPADLQVQSSSDTAAFVRLAGTKFPRFVLVTLQLLCAAVYLFVLSLPMAVLYLAITLLSVMLQAVISRAVTRSAAELKAGEVALGTVIADLARNRSVVKTFSAQPWANDLLDRSGRNFSHLQQEVIRTTMPLQMAGILCGLAPLFGLCLAGVVMIPAEQVTVSAFLSAFYLCQAVLPEQLHYADRFGELAKALPSLRRLNALWRAPVPTTQPTIGQELALEGVSYRYPNQTSPGLQDISLRIPSGRRIGVVGASGSGKSTLLQLLAGQLIPQSGQVTHPAACYFCRQTPYLFEGTAAENITLFAPVQTEAYATACYLACVDEFLPQLLQGDATPLSNDSAPLSGGQRQRLALARTLYAGLQSGSAALLFDEATSALDATTTRQVMERLAQERLDATLVFVTHQREVLPYLDWIYLMENGKIKAAGTFASLQQAGLLPGKEALT